MAFTLPLRRQNLIRTRRGGLLQSVTSAHPPRRCVVQGDRPSRCPLTGNDCHQAGAPSTREATPQGIATDTSNSCASDSRGRSRHAGSSPARDVSHRPVRLPRGRLDGPPHHRVTHTLRATRRNVTPLRGATCATRPACGLKPLITAGPKDRTRSADPSNRFRQDARFVHASGYLGSGPARNSPRTMHGRLPS